jgi:hypothetical protein
MQDVHYTAIKDMVIVKRSTHTYGSYRRKLKKVAKMEICMNFVYGIST